MSESERSPRWVSRPVLGVFIIIGLVLLLQIPIALIRGTVRERTASRNEAVAGVEATWGDQQAIVGPRLVVPRHRVVKDHEVEDFVSLLPASLSGTGRVSAHTLRRGLFTVPVYTTDLRLEGRFDPSELDGSAIDDGQLRWDRARLVVEVSDPKALAAGASASWQGAPVTLKPVAAGGSQGVRGIHAEVTKPRPGSGDFELHLLLQGSEALWLVPFAHETDVRMEADWPDPSFAGAWLPTERQVDQDGFTARWRIPSLGRNYPQVWTSSDDPHEQVMASRFGVQLLSPIDHYRMSERSTKYAPLFLVLTFGVLWLFDTLTGIRVHPMHYLLVGAGMCTFYLLELSLSEHIGFMSAYAIASTAVVGLLGAYGKTVLRSTKRGVMLGGAVAALYAYLLALLTMEDYALLVGSIGLFVVLVAVMYLTRWVEWERVGRAGEAPGV